MLTERLYWVGVFKVGRRRRKKERRGEIGRKNARPRKQPGYKGPLEMPKRGEHTSPEEGIEQGCLHRTHSREEEGGRLGCRGKGHPNVTTRPRGQTTPQNNCTQRETGMSGHKTPQGLRGP